MINFPLVSTKNILIVTPTNLYYSSFKIHHKSYKFETFKSYKTFDDLFEIEKNNRDLIVLLNNNSSFEDEVEIESYLSDESLIYEALESEIKKKSIINANTLFHHIEIKNKSAKDKQRYKIFGFDQMTYKLLLQSIPNKSALSLITTAEALLFNFCQTFIKKPYIGLYRFYNQDILIASDTDNLLFSRSHFNKESDLTSTIRSIEYVMQRFNNETFEIYIGGDFVDSSFKSSLQESLGSTIHTFKKTSYPIFLKGIKNLPKLYNFIPKNISIQRFLNKLRESLLLITLTVFLVSVIAFFINYNYYQESLNVYQNIERKYKSELKSLDLVGYESLNQLSKIKKIRSLENLKTLNQLLEIINSFSQEMIVKTFHWIGKKRGDFIDITMKKEFKSLSEMDNFLWELEKSIKLMETKLPRLYVEKALEFKALELNIHIFSRQSRKHTLHNKVGS